MVTQITYARLYNLGNYENERLEIVVTVEEGDVAAAFIEAREAVEAERVRAAQTEKERLARAQQGRREQLAKVGRADDEDVPF